MWVLVWNDSILVTSVLPGLCEAQSVKEKWHFFMFPYFFFDLFFSAMPSRAMMDAHPLRRIWKEGSGNPGCPSTLISNVRKKKKKKLWAYWIVTPCQIPEGKVAIWRYLLLASLLAGSAFRPLALTLTRAEQPGVLTFKEYLLLLRALLSLSERFST